MTYIDVAFNPDRGEFWGVTGRECIFRNGHRLAASGGMGGVIVSVGFILRGGRRGGRTK